MIENLLSILKKLRFHEDKQNPQLVLYEKCGNIVKTVKVSHSSKEFCLKALIELLKTHNEDTSFIENRDYTQISEFTGHIGNIDLKLKF